MEKMKMQKYKAAFVCSNPKNIDYVYSPEQQKKIGELTDLCKEIVTHENIDSLDLSNVDVIFSTWGMLPLTVEEIQKKMPRLKALFYAAGATDSFAMPFLENGVKISSAWKANGIPVAEFTVAQIILSMKNYFSNSWSNRFTGPGCYGETVALIGSGTISKMVQKLLKNFHLEVMVIPSLPRDRTISIEEAFRKAYVVSNHLFNHENNKKCLTKEMFLSMRKGATFINTGRGAQVDMEGFIEAFKERPDLTALLDVTDPEEPPRADSPLYTLPNVRMTSHIAGSLNDEVHRMADYAIKDFQHFAAGEKIEHEVTREILQHF